MTCNEFLDMTSRAIAAGLKPSTQSRGERAAMFRHMEECNKCRQFVLRAAVGGRPPPEDAMRVAIDDLDDPEYREARGWQD